MIIFHEGLPGSGKSYEAMVRHIVPSLQQGREVFAYIEGIDFAKVAEVAELPEEKVRELLHQVERDQVKAIHQHVRDNALVVLDEAQNFWPTQRRPLDDDLTQFVTEHRHRGLDLLLMGQDMRDVHPLWRRRVSQKVVFNKLDALGMEKRYSYVVWKATRPEHFEKVSNGIASYDPKYFGTYASHVSEDTNTANYKDSRASFANTFLVKWGLPLAIGGAVWGIWSVWGFFHPDLAKASTVAPVTTAAAASAPAKAASAVTQAAAPLGFVEDLNKRFRPRLDRCYGSGGQFPQICIIEWYDGDQLRERLTSRQLAVMGATVEVRESVARVAGTWVTRWPLQQQAQPAMVGAQVVPLNAVASAQ